jgi:hypothetical protein
MYPRINKMKKYRKTTLTEAEQWFPDAMKAERKNVNGNLVPIWPNGVYYNPISLTGYSLETLEGIHEVTPGDWIAKGVHGERYPIKPDIFAKTYEEVL